MASNRLRRGMRGAVAAGAVAMTVSVVPIVWAFTKVGVSLPRSSGAQSGVGTAVPTGGR